MSEYDRLKAVEMRRIADTQDACADALAISPNLSEDEREIAEADYRNMARESRVMAIQYENMGNQDG